MNISLSSANIELSGSLNISLLAVDPPPNDPRFNDLNLWFKRPDKSSGIIAEYNKFTKTFEIFTQLDSFHVGRINILGANTVAISPIRFADEKTKYYFSFRYFSGKMETVDDGKVELENVYGMKSSLFYYKVHKHDQMCVVSVNRSATRSAIKKVTLLLTFFSIDEYQMKKAHLEYTFSVEVLHSCRRMMLVYLKCTRFDTTTLTNCGDA